MNKILEQLGFTQFYPQNEMGDVQMFHFYGTDVISGRKKILLKAWYSQDEGSWGIQHGNNKYVAQGNLRDESFEQELTTAIRSANVADRIAVE